jgi:hypothetical protein
MVEAVKSGGLVFDLQVIRPNPVVEAGGRIVCEIDGEPLFHMADAATAAVDRLVRAGVLLDQAVDDHDVRKHYADGAELLDDFRDKERRIPRHAVPELRRITDRCAVRERCRLRRLSLTRTHPVIVR